MGLLREGINEVIATTRHNAAPMGIILRNEKIRMILFQGSHTSEQVESEGWVVANFTNDPVLYVTTAFDDLPGEAFVEEQAGGMRVFRLLTCDAWSAFSAKLERKTREAFLISLTPIREVQISPGVHPVNRGFNSIIEATIHGTRYLITHDPDLLSLIEHHAGIVKKCGGSRESEALNLLFEYIGYP
jgi:hypothetical protein